MSLKVELFDTDGTQTFRDRVSARIKAGYVWPIDKTIKPLKSQDSEAIFVIGCGHSGTSVLATILGRSQAMFLVG